MFTLPDVPFSYNALEPYIDEETMRIHHTKHHAAYIKNLNDTLSSYPQYENKSVEEILRSVSDVPSEIRQKVINFGGGHVNHMVYWKSLSNIHDQHPSGKLLNAIIKTFSSVDALIAMLTKIALGRFGSGWAWLVMDNGTLRVIDTANQDSPLSLGFTVLLGIDVWEHAYYLKYRSARAEYLENIMKVINWREIGHSYTKLV